MLERNTTSSSMKPCELNYLVEILRCFQENCFLLAIQDGNTIGCLMKPSVLNCMKPSVLNCMKPSVLNRMKPSVLNCMKTSVNIPWYFHRRAQDDEQETDLYFQ